MAAADNQRPEIKIEIPKKKEIKKSKKIALCAVFSALGVVLLYMGAIFEVLDLSAAAIASMLCVVIISEIGGIYPWLVYAVTSLLSLLLLPNKFGALIYACMAGYYPMLKAKIEGLRSNGLRLLFKIGFFNLSRDLHRIRHRPFHAYPSVFCEVPQNAEDRENIEINTKKAVASSDSL